MATCLDKWRSCLPPNTSNTDGSFTAQPYTEEGCCNFIKGDQSMKGHPLDQKPNNTRNAIPVQQAPPVSSVPTAQLIDAHHANGGSNIHTLNDSPPAYNPNETPGQPQTAQMVYPPPPAHMLMPNMTFEEQKKTVYDAGYRAGCYTGCVECCTFDICRPNDIVDPNQVSWNPELMKAHHDGATNGRCCACLACAPTFLLCTIM